MVGGGGSDSSAMDTSEPKLKFSFLLKRKEEVKLVEAAKEIITVTVDSDEEREHEEEERQAKRRKISHIEDGIAPRDDDEKKKSSTVIPMVIENDWRVAKLLELEKEGKATDADRAKLAILTEEKPFQSTESIQDGNSIVVDDAQKVTADADYSAVPIEDYGLAILRGCGWRDGEGIGRVPQVVPLRLPNRRPKGLGLGAVVAQKEKGKGGKEGEEQEKEITRDSLIRIVTGRHTGMYAKVESRDDDNNSIFVRLALGGQSMKVSLFAVQQVSKKEYDRDSKCINKGEYDKEKDRIDRKREEMVQSGRKDDRRDRDRTRDGGRQDEAPQRQTEDTSEVWVRPDLVVRFVDEKFSKGLLFSQKMRVVDVASRKEISLEDDRGNVHYGLRQSWMETVIPRNEGEQVMVVRGRYAGAAAIMEKKDKRKSRIVARLLNRDKVVEVDFDDVCYFRPKNIDDYDD